MQIETNLYARQGKAITNFKETLPSPQSDLAHEIIKSPYNFEFLTIEDKVNERNIEKALTNHIRDFILELGQGFSFVGSQYPLKLGEESYFLDLLFYNIKLKAYTIIELKSGPFKPEYAGIPILIFN
jgi:predicted nuclease of restriction endonuclease-like (RecB) superfamily